MAVIVTPSSTSGTPANIANGFAAGTKTFTNLNGGVTFPACKVVIGFGNDQAADPVGFTVGGVALNKMVAESGNFVQFWYADVSAGTTDSCSFTNGTAFDKVGVVCWQVTGAALGTANNTGTEAFGSQADPQSVTITNSANGGAVAFIWIAPLAASSTTTWGNTTNSAGDMTTFTVAVTAEVAGAHNGNSGSQAMTVSGSTPFSFLAGMVAAAFDAAAVASGARMLSLLNVGKGT